MTRDAISIFFLHFFQIKRPGDCFSSSPTRKLNQNRSCFLLFRCSTATNQQQQQRGHKPTPMFIPLKLSTGPTTGTHRLNALHDVALIDHAPKTSREGCRHPGCQDLGKMMEREMITK